MTKVIAPVSALLLSCALLLMGNGLQVTLLPVRANLEAFSAVDIGVLGSAYYLGFAGGCLIAAHAIRRVGHIRAFVAMVSIASTVALVHAIILSPVLWWLFRMVTGFCFAGLFMIIESWLNERATNETRGRIFSVYTTINLTVIVIGQLMLTLDEPQSFTLFCLASILVSLAAVPVAMTTAQAPSPITVVRVRLRHLYRLSPVGFVGCFVVGLVNGAFWAMGPIYALRTGLDRAGIAIFMSVAVFAGALGQWPLGRASDKFDRRKIIVAAAFIAGSAGVLVNVSGHFWPEGLLVAVFCFGLCSFPVHSLCVAHTNDFVGPTEYVEVSSGLLLVFAAGAVIGPLFASSAVQAVGVDGLFGFTAAVHFCLVVFVLLRLRVRARPPVEERVEFADALRSVGTVGPVDPRFDGDVEQAEGSVEAAEPAAER